MDLISVVVAVYNTEETLERCINSIINQTYENLQIILVNDGSTDKSEELCNYFSDNDKRVTVINKENGGLTTARYTGFKNAEGKYIVFLDSDDYIAPNYIRAHYNNIINTGSQVSVCNYFFKDGEKEQAIHFKYKKKIFQPDDYLSELILPRVFHLPSDDTYIPNFVWLRMYEKDLITNECFVSEREVYTEDVFFNFSIYERCSKVAVLEDCLYYYCYNNDSLTHMYRNNKWYMELNRIKLLKKYLKKYDINNDLRISMALFKSVWGCIENASYLSSYKEFKHELIEVFNNREVRQELTNVQGKYLTKGERIVYIGYKYKLYKILYLYKKMMKRGI